MRQSIFRQGDVLIIPTTGVKPKAKPLPRDEGRVVLAYGEVTGHAHAILDSEAFLYAGDELEGRFLQVLAEGGVDLRHEEHATITIPQGDYIVRRQRQYTPEAIERVAD